MTRLSLIAALLIATLLAPAAHAQQSKKDLIAKVLQLQKAQHEQFGQSLANQPLQQLIPQAMQLLRTKVPEDKREATGKAMDAELKAYFTDVSPKLQASAAKHAAELVGAKLETFSEAELRQLLQFMESPVIKRYNQISGDIPATLAQRIAAEQRGMLEARVRLLETRLADLLGLKAAAGSAPAASKP